MKSKFSFFLLIVLFLTSCKGASTPTVVVEPTQVPTQVATSTLLDIIVAPHVVATLTAQTILPTPLKEGTSTLTPPPEATATVAMTATVIPTSTQAPSPTPSPTPVQASATGKVCYIVGQVIPAMTAYFQNSTTGAVTELPIAAGQITYTIDLIPGTYIAYAWLSDYSLGGLYSNAVPCGLKSSCDDHAARPFSVQVGQETKEIDICDWYTGPFMIPYPPGKEPASTVGSISGYISYPGGNPPAFKVVAFNLKTKYWYWMGTVPGDLYFSFTELPPGTYNVVAYTDNGQAGGYADSAHELIGIVVKAGETSSIEINDWEGSFPANPVK